MTLIFSLLLSTACTSLLPKSAVPTVVQNVARDRCPADDTSCLSLVPISFIPNTVPMPVPEGLEFSPLTLRIYDTLKKLELPLLYENENADLGVIELTFTQFVEAYQSFPGGKELVQIYANPSNQSGTEIKKDIDEWINKFLPSYRVTWNQPGEDNFIPQETFFPSLQQKNIPIGDHHDILAHLFLYTDPQLRDLTERIAALYERAQIYERRHATPPSQTKMTSIVNSLWTRLQEFTPIQYVDRNGRSRIAILGGGPSVAEPFEPARGKFETWSYFLKISPVYSGIETALNSRRSVKNSVEMSVLFNKIIRHIEKITDITPGNKTDFVISEMDSVPLFLSSEFSDASEGRATYDERWLEFSDRILRNHETALLVLRPEHHRHLMKLSIELMELLLEDFSP